MKIQEEVYAIMKSIPENEFTDNMIKQMELVNALTDLIADNFNITKSDAFIIALSEEESLPYIRELKLRSLL